MSQHLLQVSCKTLLIRRNIFFKDLARRSWYFVTVLSGSFEHTFDASQHLLKVSCNTLLIRCNIFFRYLARHFWYFVTCLYMFQVVSNRMLMRPISSSSNSLDALDATSADIVLSMCLSSYQDALDRSEHLQSVTSSTWIQRIMRSRHTGHWPNLGSY